jgi:hypothetical protein
MLLSFKILDTPPTLPGTPEKIQGHLEAASIHHTKAEHHLKDGAYKKAAKHALLAQKYLDLANEHIRKYYPKVETSVPIL